MRTSIIGFAAAAAAAAAVALTVGSASAMPFGGLGQAADALTAIEKTQFVYLGRNYCWYPDGWHGPGFYWCGYAYRTGFGWGGPVGWRGWHHGGRGGVVVGPRGGVGVVGPRGGRAFVGPGGGRAFVGPGGGGHAFVGRGGGGGPRMGGGPRGGGGGGGGGHRH